MKTNLSVDRILTNGRIVTLDDAGTVAEAFAVKDGRIAAVGRADEIAALAAPGVETVDLEGRLVLPGFIDSHMHPLLYGMDKLKVDCGSKAIRSVDQILDNIRAAARSLPKGEWVLCSEYKPALLRENRKIHRDELDAVAPDNPVFLPTIHALSTNTLGLAAAGITADTPDPQGGHIERTDGRPNGFLSETAVHLLIDRLPPWTMEDRIRALELVGEELTEHGVTSVHEAGGVADIPNPELFRSYQIATRAGRWKQRAYVMFTINKPEHMEDIRRLGFATGFGDDRLRVGCAKLFIDGAFALGKAAVYGEDGTPTDDRLIWPPDRLREMIRELNELGWQVAAHAQGDRAIDVTLDGYVLSGKDNPHRNRIEHGGLSTPALQRRYLENNIPLATQPNLMHYFGTAAVAYGKAKLPWVYPFNTLLRLGLRLGGGSDCRATPPHPLMGIWNAVVRHERKTGAINNPQERITVDQAVRLFTRDNAWFSFEEDRKGRIEPGLLADVVALDRDIYTVDPETIPDTHVDLTLIGGEIVRRTF